MDEMEMVHLLTFEWLCFHEHFSFATVLIFRHFFANFLLRCLCRGVEGTKWVLLFGI